MLPTFSFASAGVTNKSLSIVLLSATYPADRTRMSYRKCFQLLYITSAAVPDWTFSKCPAERKAVAVGRKFDKPLISDVIYNTKKF